MRPLTPLSPELAANEGTLSTPDAAGSRLGQVAPHIRTRLAIALSVGALTFVVAYWHLSVQVPYYLAYDFTYPWRAAQAILAGGNPYAVVHFLKYPLPAAIIAIPFAALPPAAAGATFIGLSSALMIFALIREDFHFLPDRTQRTVSPVGPLDPVGTTAYRGSALLPARVHSHRQAHHRACLVCLAPATRRSRRRAGDRDVVAGIVALMAGDMVSQRVR